MPVEVPAGRETLTRKESIYARLGLRRIKEKFRLAVFLQHGIEVLHCYRTVRVAIEAGTEPENNIIARIRQEDYRNPAQHHREQKPFPSHSVWNSLSSHQQSLL